MEHRSERIGEPRLSVWLTREGWIFLVILLFVSAGSLLRNINLLMLMTGIMIAPLFLSWRGSLLMLRQLTARRSLPPQLFAGEAVPATWKVTNHRTALPTWSLTVQDRVRKATAPAREAARVRTLLPRIGPGETSYGTYQLFFPQRGRFLGGPAQLSSRFPLGLVAARLDMAEEETILVAPALGKLTASWDRRLLSHASGSESVKRRQGAQDEEFFGLRQYRSGDSRRHIHWRATARSGQLMVKQFDSRSDRDFVLILDLWLPGGNDQRERALAEQGLSFAATVMKGLSTVIRGKVAIGVCGAETIVQCDVNTPQFISRIWDELAVAEPSPQPELGPALEHIAQQISGGTPFYVLSTRAKPENWQLFIASGEQSANLAGIEPWIRWVEIGGEEFRELFTPPATLQAPAVAVAEEVAHVHA
jgi:hypothetical protein